MAIRFYLDNRPNKVGEHPIRVSVCVKGTKTVSTIGHSVTPEVWADGTVAKAKYTNSKGITGKQINAEIMKLQACFAEYELNTTERPDRRRIRDIITANLGRKHSPDPSGGGTSLFSDLDRFINAESLSGQWAHSTIRCWGTFRSHLFKHNPHISYDDFDEDGINHFLTFLRYKQKLTEKTVKKVYTHLKWFLGWARRKGLCEQTAIGIYRPKFKVLEKPVIFLTKEELLKLYHFPIPRRGTMVSLRDFEGRTYEKRIACEQSLEKTRDLFCFCAFTGLRYSDMAALKRTDITEDGINVITEKTDCALKVPFNAYSRTILQKYEDENYPGNLALPVISNQKMNEYLKDICELCGFTTPVKYSYYKDNARYDEVHPKWAVLGTHGGRRTFICAALEMGIPTTVIRKITGHANEAAMRPYIAITDKTKADAMSKFSDRKTV